MRFFNGTGKVSEELVRKAKSHISDQLLGKHGITSVATQFNEEEGQRYFMLA